MGVFDDFRLDGRTALVTGGGRGIGRAISSGLAEAGANVAVNYHTHEQAAKDTVAELEKHGVGAIPVQADVSDKRQVESMTNRVRDWKGSIDILVNNAGVARDKPALDYSEEDYDFLFDVNVKGVFLCSKVVGRGMVERKQGAILNISSISGFISNRDQVLYNASKGSVTMVTKSLASEWAQHNVRVNAIAPGYVDTDMTRPTMEENSEVVEQKWLPNTPMGRVGRPEELAGAALFLVSDAASFVTGETVVVDGGYMIE